MTTFRLGVEDASHALVVSRALERLMKERGLSAVEAINDLSSKLNTTKLVSCSDGQDAEEPPLASSRPSSPQLQRSTPTLSTTMSTDRVPATLQQQQQRKGRKVAYGQDKECQKGTQEMDLQRVCCENAPTRERADSVTEAVEQKAKKARLSPEDSPEVETAADSSGTTIVVRAKRNSHEQQEQVQSNCLKKWLCSSIYLNNYRVSFMQYFVWLECRYAVVSLAIAAVCRVS